METNRPNKFIMAYMLMVIMLKFLKEESFFSDENGLDRKSSAAVPLEKVYCTILYHKLCIIMIEPPKRMINEL